MLETLSTRETGMLYNKELNIAVLDTIGLNGLDTQTHPTALDPEWLTKADNIVYTEGNRITFRKGLKQKTDAEPTDSHIGALYENRSTDIVYAASGQYFYKIDFSDIDNAFVNPNTDVVADGSTTFGYDTGASDDDWQFAEIEEGLVAVQSGEDVQLLNGGTWDLMSNDSGYSAPAGVTTFDPSCALGQFGRLWVGGVSEDNSVLYYSKIEDPVAFNNGDAGSIDLKYVWGNDEIVAIKSFGGKLAIFGKQNIALYNNPADITNIYLDEVINNTGCIARDSIQSIGDDIYFLSDSGVRSLYRTAQLDKFPLREISLTVKDEVISNAHNSQNVKSVYSLDEGLYILSFTDINVTYVFDIKYPTPKGTPRVTKWRFDGDREPISLAYSRTYGLLFGEEDGHICTYEGYHEVTYDGTSFTNTPFTGSFSTAVLDLGGGAVSSILKKLLMVVSGGSGTNVGIKAFKDFELAPSTSETFTVNAPIGGTAYKWGEATALYGCNTSYDYGGVGYCSTDGSYNTQTACTTAGETWSTITDTSADDQPTNCSSSPAKFAPIHGLKEVGIQLRGDAKYLRFEMDGVTNGYRTALQSITLLYKRGKMY